MEPIKFNLKYITHASGSKVIWFQSLIFLIIATLLLLKPLSYGLFIDKVGIENLPLAYILIAVVSTIFTFLYGKIVTGKEPLYLLTLSFIIAIIVLLGVFSLEYFYPRAEIVFYILFVFISIYGLMSASQFWLSINTYFSRQNVKRNFGKLGTAAILGGIFGGYFASAWTLYFSAESILLAVIFLLVIGIFIVEKIKSKYRTIEERYIPDPTQNSPVENFIPWRLVWNNQHLKLLAIIIFLSVFAAKIIDYEYGYFASINYDTEEELTSFFAFWFATINFIALGIQIFFTNRIIGKIGIARSIFILPTLLIIGTLALLILPGLIFAIIVRAFDGSFKQTIQKASVELVLLPIPQQLKLRTKTFLDVTVDNVATGVSGVFLLFILESLALSNAWVIIILLLILMAWFAIALNIKKEYLKSFRLSLRLGKKDINESTIINSLKQILEDGSDFQIQKTVAKLSVQQTSELSHELVKLLDRKNPVLLESVINKLNVSKKDFGERILVFASDANSHVRLTALRYLLNHNESIDKNFFLDRINDPDLLTRSMSLLAISMEYHKQADVIHMFQVEKRLEDLVQEIQSHGKVPGKTEIYTNIFRIIGYLRIASRIDWMESFLDYDNENRAGALIGVGIVGKTKNVERILDLMEQDENVVESGVEALALFDFRLIYKTTINLIQKKSYQRLQFFPMLLSHFPNPESIGLLINLSKSKDKNLTRKSVAAINQIISRYPLLPVENKTINQILLNEIEYFNDFIQNFSRIGQIMESNVENANFFMNVKAFYGKVVDDQLATIFQLLNIKYPPENISELLEIFKSNDNETRENAIDYLNNLLSPGVKDQLFPILTGDFVARNNIGRRIKIDSYEFHSSLINFTDGPVKKELLEFFNCEIGDKVF